jgi:flavodoxin I
MKALIVYDSVFGNTEKVAQAIAGALGPADSVTAVKVGEAGPEHLEGVSLLLVGSPTRAFRPTPGATGFVRSLSPTALQGVRVAAFDTRISTADANSGFLKFLVKLFGYAAEPLAAKLQKKGGTPAAPPEGFFVGGTEGPLKDGELERAAQWARRLTVRRMGASG